MSTGTPEAGTGSTLTITGDRAADAGAYDCVVFNACGVAVSNSALVAVTRSPSCCPADINGDGEINADDLGDFITCCFASAPCGTEDFNRHGNVNQDDLGDFITTYFSRPC